MTALLSSCHAGADTPQDTDPAPDAAPSLSEEEIAAIVDEQLALLVPEARKVTSEAEYISKAPEAFDAILALGPDAVPYLEKLASGIAVGDASADNYRRILAKAASYAIAPEHYDVLWPSPDGSLAVKAVPDTFLGMAEPDGSVGYSLSLIDASNGMIKIPTSLTVSAEALQEGVNAVWSPDGRYAAVHHTGEHGGTVYLFSVEERAFFPLPGKTELDAALGELMAAWDAGSGSVLAFVHPIVTEWPDADTVRVSLTLKGSGDASLGAGFYTYHLKNRAITALAYHTTVFSDTTEGWYTVPHRFVYLVPDAPTKITASYFLLAGPDASVCDAVNTQILDYIRMLYAAAPETPTQSVLKSEVMLLDANRFSIHLYGQHTPAGSVQHISDAGFVFDLRDGSALPLSDLFEREELKKMLSLYFDSLKATDYPTTFLLTKPEELRAEFEKRFLEGGDSVRLYAYWLGEEALYLSAGWCKGYTFDTGFEFQGDRGFIAALPTGSGSAAREVVLSASDDGSYTVAGSLTAGDVWSGFRLTDMASGRLLCRADLTGKSASVYWSPDHKRAAVTCTVPGITTETVLMDSGKVMAIRLPDKTELSEKIRALLPEDGMAESYARFASVLRSWYTNTPTAAIIEFCLSNPGEATALVGSYTFDTTTLALTNLEVALTVAEKIPPALIP